VHFLTFKADHLRYMTPLKECAHDHAVLVASGQASQLEAPFSYSGWHELKCIAAAGLIHIRSHRAVAWAILTPDCDKFALSIVRRMRRGIELSPYRRVEMSVNCSFEKGMKLATAVGMKLETPEPLRGYGANGEDEYLYSFVKG